MTSFFLNVQETFFLLQTPDILEKPKVPPPGLSASWAFPVGGVNNNNSEMFQEDEDPCAICHEDLTIGSAITLECDHQFHDTVSNEALRL